MLLSLGSLPAAQQERPAVWFGPNTGCVDSLALFTSPQSWAVARAGIDVFLFDDGQLGTGGWSCLQQPWYNCASNHLDEFTAVDAFAKLEAWGIELASMATFAGPIASLDPVVCTSEATTFALSVNGGANVILNVEANGGSVRYLALDEPLRQWLPEYYYVYTGQTDPRPCRAESIDDVADDVAAYIHQMAEFFPTVSIGHVEIYPEVSAGQFMEWILALEARGVSLPFLHLDVHGIRLAQYAGWGLPVDLTTDLLALSAFCGAHGVDFGVIYTDVNWDTQLWAPGAYDDAFYFDRTLAFVDQVLATGAEMDNAVFHSWVGPYTTAGSGPNEVPDNLPGSVPGVFSHTRLVVEAMQRIHPEVAEPGPTTPLCPGRRRRAGDRRR